MFKCHLNAQTNTQDRKVDYTDDAVGNRTTVTDTAPTPLQPASYTTNNLNQYTAVDGNNPSYDGNGNMVAASVSGTSWTYSYDAQNRLVSGGNGTVSFTFTYDARNRCVTRTINGTLTFYYFDDWNLIQEHQANDVELKRYIHGAAIDEIVAMIDTAGTHYYHHDALGNVTFITNGTGDVEESYVYDIYGKPMIKDGNGNVIVSSAIGNRFLLTGREWINELGLYDYRNRIYSVELGRFLQTDPIRVQIIDWLSRDPIEEKGRLNLYRYVSNDPVEFTDPDGLFPFPFWWGGKWGGPGMVNGQLGKWRESDPGWPEQGQPGWVEPNSGEDWCYYYHDRDLRKCCKIKCPDERKKCNAKADSDLVACQDRLPKKNLHSKLTATVFRKLKPNNNAKPCKGY